MENVLYISQKAFSLWGKYEVTNASDKPVYTVQGVPALLRKQFVYDVEGQEIGSIQEKMSFLSRFSISEYGQEKGSISSQFSFLHTKLDLDYYQWSVEGDFWGWNYDVFDRFHHLIASIRKEPWHFTDHFVIHFEYEKDSLSLLLLVLAIDCICDRRRAANS